MNICCILNEKSGGAEGPGHQQIAETFLKRGFQIRVLLVRQDLPISELVKNAQQLGSDVIVAGGGDGTVNAVATALVGQQKARLGILPLGTLNHLAKDLKIPTTLSGAVDVICDGNEKPSMWGK